jgi:hypothetical protein
MGAMSDIFGEAQEAYAYMTRRASWWPRVDHDDAWDHVAYIAEMVVAYVECARWSSADDDGTPLDMVPARIASEEWAAVAMTCAYFYTHNARDLRGHLPWSSPGGEWSGAGQAGHDLWLTRNGHGAGFWDRNSERADPAGHAAGERLSAAARELGEAYLYLDRDTLHIEGLAFSVMHPHPGARDDMRTGLPTIASNAPMAGAPREETQP